MWEDKHYLGVCIGRSKYHQITHIQMIELWFGILIYNNDNLNYDQVQDKDTLKLSTLTGDDCQVSSLE